MGINIEDEEEEDVENIDTNTTTTEMMVANKTDVTRRPLPYNPYWNEEVNKFSLPNSV